MASIELDLSALRDATRRLQEAMEARQAEPSNELYRDATIQRFEFTYELAHKMLRRYLALASADPQTVEQLLFADLVRTGNRQGLLLGTWDDWRGYRTARAITSHTYDQAKADQVLATIPTFATEALHLLTELQERTSTPEGG